MLLLRYCGAGSASGGPRTPRAGSGPAMMACAELLAVCLLPAKPGPEPRREPLPIFHDVSAARGLELGAAGRGVTRPGAARGGAWEARVAGGGLRRWGRSQPGCLRGEPRPWGRSGG